MSCSDSGIVVWGAAGDVLMGEVEGVISKGVCGWVLSMNSKLERLDGGLVLASDDVILGGTAVCSFSVTGPGVFPVDSCFLEKRPELSLFCS